MVMVLNEESTGCSSDKAESTCLNSHPDGDALIAGEMIAKELLSQTFTTPSFFHGPGTANSRSPSFYRPFFALVQV